MTDLDRVGGVQVVMKELLDAGLLHGDCVTVTGKTIAENLADDGAAGAGRRRRPPDGSADPPEGGIAILRGSLAPEGSVMKIAGAESLEFRGRARPFDSENEAFDALTAGKIVAGRRRS